MKIKITQTQLSLPLFKTYLYLWCITTNHNGSMHHYSGSCVCKLQGQYRKTRVKTHFITLALKTLKLPQKILLDQFLSKKAFISLEDLQGSPK